jgi:HSP20 family protein
LFSATFRISDRHQTAGHFRISPGARALGKPPRGLRAAATQRIGRTIMAMRDLIPWNRGREVSVRRDDDANPFLALRREMNRLFDDVFRGFDLAPSRLDRRMMEGSVGWPNLEVSEKADEITVAAELPGLDEKDVEIKLGEGMLVISGEKKHESEDKDRLFSERYYGRFERRIAVDDIDPDKVSASFKNGVLTVTLPRVAEARSSVRRIPINGH